MTKVKMNYAIEWRRTYPDGKTRRAGFKEYKSKADAQKEMSTWLSEWAAGEYAPYQNQIELVLLERPAPAKWHRTDWKPE